MLHHPANRSWTQRQSRKGQPRRPLHSWHELPEALFSWWTWPAQPPLEHLKRLPSPTSNMPCSKGCLQTSLLEAKTMSREDYVVRGILRTGIKPCLTNNPTKDTEISTLMIWNSPRAPPSLRPAPAHRAVLLGAEETEARAATSSPWASFQLRASQQQASGCSGPGDSRQPCLGDSRQDGFLDCENNACCPWILIFPEPNLL